ncbi:hypothetical protein L195_g046638, partial [Trifolium pratense]
VFNVMVRRALLVGITYKDDEKPLKASANNTILVKHILSTRFRFRSKNVKVMIDQPSKKSTRTKRYLKIRNPLNSAVIIENLQQMIRNAKSGDQLVFMISGHSLVDDNNGSVLGFLTGPDKDGSGSYLSTDQLQTMLSLIPPDTKQISVSDDNLGIIFASAENACYSAYYRKWRCHVSDFVLALITAIEEDKNVGNMELIQKIDEFLKNRYEKDQKSEEEEEEEEVVDEGVQQPSLYC